MRLLLLSLTTALISIAPAKATELYIGAFGTATFIDSTIRNRDTGRNEAVDVGGDGFGAGLRAGAGWRPVRWLYTGVEIEGIRQINTSSRYKPADYRATLLYSAAIFGRVGYEWEGRGMVYARGGYAAIRIQGTEWLNTPAFGGGLEVRLSDAWSLRMDATHYLAAGRNDLESTVLTGGVVLRLGGR